MSNFLFGKKVAIIGLGVSGKSALKLASILGATTFVSDIKDPKEWSSDPDIAKYCVKSNCFKQDDFKLADTLVLMDWIILSPGIPREMEFLKKALSRGVQVVNEIEIACRFILAPIIGVTGTNGKTTTVTMLGEMAKASFPRVFVGGNIGTPLSDIVAQEALNLSPDGRSDFKVKMDLVILELSSFQLESMPEFHPRVAVILNIAANHGERYEKVEDYARAKFLITKNMKRGEDFLIYNKEFPPLFEWAKSLKMDGRSLATNEIEDYKKELSVQYDLSHFKLPGNHNLFNLFVAVLSLRSLKMENKNSIQNVINNFKGVYHRIEFVPNSSGHLIYNDAKSTNWEATLTAIKSMPEDKGPLYLIIGGQRRGRGDSLAPIFDEVKKRVSCLYLIGDMAQELAQEIDTQINYKKTMNLESTWEDLKKQTKGIVLLSPGFPSFDQFKNYSHRGECFKRIVSEGSNS